MKPLLLLPRLVEKLDAVLERLEPLLPIKAKPVNWARSRAAIWKKQHFTGHLVAVSSTPKIDLDDVLGVDTQKALLMKNTQQFVRSMPANNVLLTGSKGTGKSSLIQALLNHFGDQGLRLIQVDKSDLADLMDIVEALAEEPFRFILFCDDLSFEQQDEGYKALKSALDGGVYTAPDNILIYATSNRRHLLPEYHSDNAGASNVATEIHHTEVVEENSK